MISILDRYFSARVVQMILAVFFMTFGMLFIVDFVELLRRTSDRPEASAGLVAYLSLLRVPAASEQLMPFCVLGGAMVAFLDLSRKLELLVARAAGVSAWGFLAGPLAFAALLGAISVAILNPAFATLKGKGEAIETRLIVPEGAPTGEGVLWLRQKSIDGQAIIRAARADEMGTHLESVAAYLYDADGAFEAEVDAPVAELLDGVWRFDEARIVIPGEETIDVGTFLLATNLVPGEVTKGLPSPERIPFWSLPGFIHETELAGLDTTAYRLHFQSLLARPLMFVAMALVAAAFSLRFFRFGGIGNTIAGGIGAGFVLYVATKMVGDLGQTGLISAGLAAWSPPLLGSSLAILALLHQEDG